MGTAKTWSQPGWETNDFHMVWEIINILPMAPSVFGFLCCLACVTWKTGQLHILNNKLILNAYRVIAIMAPIFHGAFFVVLGWEKLCQLFLPILHQ